MKVKKMKLKIFNSLWLTLLLMFVLGNSIWAQTVDDSVKNNSKVQGKQEKSIKLNNLKIDFDNLEAEINANINLIIPKIELSLKNLDEQINLNLKDIGPKIELSLQNLDNSFNFNFQTDCDSVDAAECIAKDKFKTYSKTYSLDANDKIKLSNQYGKIVVNTWDKHEIKVDVQIKAEASDDAAAQKLLNGVQIWDNKEGSVVSFRTSIETSNGRTWKIWDWGNSGKHKLEIDYTVYMPAKNDLNIEQSYGSITLPELDGKVRLNCSYGNATAIKLSNPNNDIEGSYGSLKVDNLNSAHLDYSYGSVQIGECNNLKANLSYGSFKLGKLKGSGDLDVSYCGGFKISELANTFKKLDVNSSYSGVTLGLPGNDSFDFDVTVNYGGFSYNSDQAIITSKNPPDGSKRISMTRNYKGHYGRAGAGPTVEIHNTYGNVNFE